MKLEPIVQAKAKERQKLSEGRGQKGVQKSAPVLEQGKTRDEVAKLAGVSHDTIDKVKKIVDHGTPGNIFSRGIDLLDIRIYNMDIQ